MARTFVSQPQQVFRSERFNDTLTTGISLQSSSTTLETDLNALRTQVRQILWANVSGSWYDVVTAPSGGLSARGLNTLNTDLTDLEQKRFLFRVQNLNLVDVATGSNFALLSVSLGTAPVSFAAVGTGIATGSVVASLSGGEGTYAAASLAQVSGSSVLTPKNLVIVRDAWTGLHITGTSGKDIYGLMQVEAGVVSGDAFNDSTHRTQISFVEETVVLGTSSLRQTLGARIGGQTIMYSYVKRTALDNIPEDAYMSNTIFVDLNEGTSTGGGAAQLTDITLDRAIDNQAGTVTQDQNIDIRIAAGFHWAFLSGTKELWRLDSSDSTDTLVTAVDRFSVSSSFPSTFQSGISVATGSTSINVGVVAGTVGTQSGSNLILSGGAQLGFSDFFGPSSTFVGGIVPLATSTAQWNTYVTDFGQNSLLGALHFLSASLSGSNKRIRFNGGITTTVSADTNVTFPTNIDAQLGSYVGRDFKKDISIHLNGTLLLPAYNVVEGNDVYPGTTPSTGDLKFPYELRSGSQITLEIYG